MRSRAGGARELSLDIAPGFPGNPLSEAEHERRFDDCLAYAPWPLAADTARALREGIAALTSAERALPLWAPLFECDLGELSKATEVWSRCPR